MVKKHTLTVIVLAGGKGTRMKSPLPKVLHPVAGTPLVGRVIQAAKGAGADEVRVVVGYGRELVEKVVTSLGATTYVQTNQWGTADAVRAAKPEGLEGTVLILNGDHPLLTASDLQTLKKRFEESEADLAVVTAVMKNPGTLGRIVKQGDQIKAIVEARDASAETLKINEVNTGIYFVGADTLNEYLPLIEAKNSQNEFYLTDIISLALEGGEQVAALRAPTHVAAGVNDQRELSMATRYVFKKKAEALMQEGVIIMDPRRTYIEESVSVGSGSVIYPGVFMKGRTSLGSFCVVEPNCYFNDVQVGDSVQIRMGSYLESALIDKGCLIGPYARLRPGTEVEENAHIGNFVELKNVKFGPGAKANHLTYLGDAEVGANTNIGCGTITCNYAVDRKKYRTVIGKDAFVGSDVQFVAPVTIGDGAVIGSGSTITKDVPARALAVARGKQFVKEGWADAIDNKPGKSSSDANKGN